MFYLFTVCSNIPRFLSQRQAASLRAIFAAGKPKLGDDLTYGTSERIMKRSSFSN
jgi:hypothetical protein